jgi:hypothetical protein
VQCFAAESESSSAARTSIGMVCVDFEAPKACFLPAVLFIRRLLGKKNATNGRLRSSV